MREKEAQASFQRKETAGDGKRRGSEVSKHVCAKI